MAERVSRQEQGATADAARTILCQPKPPKALYSGPCCFLQDLAGAEQLRREACCPVSPCPPQNADPGTVLSTPHVF